DGVAFPSNPHVGRVPRDLETAHDLLVEASGHRSEERKLVLSHDQELVLHLHQLETPPHSDSPAMANDGAPQDSVHQPVTRPRPAKPAPKATSSSKIEDAPTSVPEVSQPQRAHCTPPFFYDERGIKKYRPECL